MSRIGAQARAAKLLEALLSCAQGELRVSVTLQLASIQHALAQDEAAAQLATALAEDPETDELHKTKAYLLAARALTALGRWDDAITALGRVPASINSAEQAQVQRELAKIHLRRADYDAVASAVKAGLASAAEDDPVRVELLCSCGIVANYWAIRAPRAIVTSKRSRSHVPKAYAATKPTCSATWRSAPTARATCWPRAIYSSRA